MFEVHHSSSGVGKTFEEEINAMKRCIIKQLPATAGTPVSLTATAPRALPAKGWNGTSGLIIN
jgi:hypothetical protein